MRSFIVAFKAGSCSSNLLKGVIIIYYCFLIVKTIALTQIQTITKQNMQSLLNLMTLNIGRD